VEEYGKSCSFHREAGPLILDLNDMITAARLGEYALPVFEIHGVALARAAVEAASDMDSPVVLHPVRDQDLLMPALVALAKRAPVPVAAVIGGVTSEEDAARAIRLGAHGLICPAPPDAPIPALAEACGVAIITGNPRRLREEEYPAPGLAWFGAVLDGASSPVTDKVARSGHTLPWSELVDLAAKAARGSSASGINRCGSAGRARDLATACRRRREVEHVVLYNAEGVDASRHAEVLREGVQVLSQIPGVRRVFVGRAKAGDGRYAHCWVVRFAGEGVVPLYRDHPDHMTFAERYFRPIAADRMTIDFVEV
jgi:hypothetical protein